MDHVTGVATLSVGRSSFEAAQDARSFSASAVGVPAATEQLGLGGQLADFMTHLAIWDGLAEGEDGPETEWGEQVTEAEYGQPTL